MGKQRITKYLLIMLDGCKEGLILEWEGYPPSAVYFSMPVTIDPALFLNTGDLKQDDIDFPGYKKIMYELVGINKENQWAYYREKKTGEKDTEE